MWRLKVFLFLDTYLLLLYVSHRTLLIEFTDSFNYFDKQAPTTKAISDKLKIFLTKCEKKKRNLY